MNETKDPDKGPGFSPYQYIDIKQSHYLLLYFINTESKL